MGTHLPRCHILLPYNVDSRHLLFQVQHTHFFPPPSAVPQCSTYIQLCRAGCLVWIITFKPYNTVNNWKKSFAIWHLGLRKKKKCPEAPVHDESASRVQKTVKWVVMETLHGEQTKHEIFVLTKFRFSCPILKNRKAVEGAKEMGVSALNASWVWNGFKSLQRTSLTYMCYILSYPEQRHLRWEKHVIRSQWKILQL